jgi:chemotaxis response regulator CheB
MGADGARGMLKKKANPGRIYQSEKKSVVFNLPKEAIKIGRVDQVVPPTEFSRGSFRSTG